MKRSVMRGSNETLSYNASTRHRIMIPVTEQNISDLKQHGYNGELGDFNFVGVLFGTIRICSPTEKGYKIIFHDSSVLKWDCRHSLKFQGQFPTFPYVHKVGELASEVACMKSAQILEKIEMIEDSIDELSIQIAAIVSQQSKILELLSAKN